MPGSLRPIVAVLLALHLVLGSAGVVSCAERDGSRAIEFVAAGCCVPDAPPVVPAHGEALAPEPADGCGACSDALLAATGARPDRAADARALRPLAPLGVVVATAVSPCGPGGPSPATRGDPGGRGTPRACRPALLRC